MRKSLFAFVALLSSVASASAADLGPYPPYGSVKDAPVVFVPAYLWTGFYVGAQVGYEWAAADHKFRDVTLPGVTIGGGDSEPSGFIGGGHVGYNWQTGQLVFGIEADFEGGSVNGDVLHFNPLSPTGMTFAEADLNWQGSVRGRLGYAVDRTLFYFTGGWAFADFDFKGDVLRPACCSFSETLNGWTVGGGVEYAFLPNFTVRAEYRYTDFGSTSGTLMPLMPTTRMPVDVTSQAIRLGASYKW
jgi:outer membrane immunogenic protein